MFLEGKIKLFKSNVYKTYFKFMILPVAEN